ncbi:MAG: ester cyclase [Halovenus sp.]
MSSGQESPIDRTLASDGVVMKEWTVTATHEGECIGIPPTEHSTGVSGMPKILITNGKMQEDCLYDEFHELIEQLGLTEK